MRPDGGGKRMIECLGVGADGFHILGDEPVAGFLVEARTVGVVLSTVGILVMPAGVDDHDVARAYRCLLGGLLEMLGHDLLPLAHGHIEHDTGSEERTQRNLVEQGSALDHVTGGVDMGTRVHDGRDLLCEDATLRHSMQSLDLDVLEVRPARLAQTPGVGKIDEFKLGFSVPQWPGVGHDFLSRIVVVVKRFCSG